MDFLFLVKCLEILEFLAVLEYLDFLPNSLGGGRVPSRSGKLRDTSGILRAMDDGKRKALGGGGGDKCGK